MSVRAGMRSPLLGGLVMVAIWAAARPTASGSSVPAQAQRPEVVSHAPDSAIAYEWFTYVPRSLRPGERALIWVTGLHGNLVTDRYDSIAIESRDMAERRVALAEERRLAMLVPVIPRPRTNYVYAVALAPRVFLAESEEFVRRPDLRLNAMIDRFAAELRAGGFVVDERVLLDGFSAGAMFAQRYALLHPRRVLAIAAGQCGGALTLPESTLEGATGARLDWPAGVGDFERLAGYAFDRDAYRRIAQFVYIGDQDTSNSTLVRTRELWRTQEQIDLLNRVFGRTDPARIEAQSRYLTRRGYNVTFRAYPGVGHTTTRAMRDDVFAFFDSVRTATAGARH